MLNIEEEIDYKLKVAEYSRDFCHNAYHDAPEGKKDIKWLHTKKYWLRKIELLKDIKDIIKEYNQISV